MKKIFLPLIILSLSVIAFAQEQETFDIITYTPPPGGGWKAEQKQNVIGYTITDKIKKTWCQLGIYKSTASKGNIESDFKNEWDELAVKQYKATGLTENEVITTDGWKIKAGGGKFKFNNADAMVLLTTITGYKVCVSILAITNTEDYIDEVQALLESIDLKIPDTTKANVPPGNNPPANTNTANATIAGTWIKSGSVNPVYGNPVSWGTGGYTKDEYILYPNGTFKFYSKSFGYSITNLIFVKESGTYNINGNSITLTPKSSIVEAWSKKDGTDNWGKLVSSNKRNNETVTYTFTKHYFSGIQQWNLVLQTAKPTNRDGSFSSNTLFPNAYYYAPVSVNNTAINLPPGN